MTYKLGTGVYSVRGIIKEGVLAVNIPTTAIDSGDPASHRNIDFDSKIIKSYGSLRKELHVNANLTANVVSLGSVSAGLNLLSSVELSQTDVLILVRSRLVDRVTMLKPGQFDPVRSSAEILNADKATFLRAFGDSYINKVEYGKELVALVHLKNVSEKKARDLKTILDAKLNPVGVPVGGGLHMDAGQTLNESFENTEFEVKIHCVGVLEEAPTKTDSLDVLVSVMADFADPKKSKFSEIGYSTQSYVSIINTPGASELDQFVESAKPLLDDVDQALNRVRFVIHTLDSVNDKEGRYDRAEIEELRLNDNYSALAKLRHQLESFAHVVELAIPAWVEGKRQEFLEQLSVLKSEVAKQDDILNKVYSLRSMVGQAWSDPQDRHHGFVYDHTHRLHSSDLFSLRKGARFLFWQVDPKSTSHAGQIIFDVDVKDKDHHYHGLFENISGSGQTRELPTDFSTDNVGLAIRHPRNAGGQPFRVVISETEEIDQGAAAHRPAA